MATTVIEVFGRVDDPDFHFAQHVAKRINKVVGESVEVRIEAMIELDYITRIAQLRREQQGPYNSHKHRHCIRINSKYVGHIIDLFRIAENEYGIADAEVGNLALFQVTAKNESEKYARTHSRPTVYLEFGSDENKEAYGKVIIELFNDLCPRACENFIKLCMGGEISSGVPLHYVNCPVHRVVKDGWVQSGDILDGSGAHSISAVGSQLEDECFSVDFGAPFGGIVGYANTGPHSNGSQFFITLGPCGWMNGSKVGFGRVLQGYEVLRQINTAPLKNERPEPPIRIVHCHKY